MTGLILRQVMRKSILICLIHLLGLHFALAIMVCRIHLMGVQPNVSPDPDS